MGTHPIFESDFDCLTDLLIFVNAVGFGWWAKVQKVLENGLQGRGEAFRGGHFHKLCFRCSACNKGLDSFTLTIHNENLFCKSCYGKNFGPSGYGFGGGGAGLMASEKSGPYVPKSAPQQTAPIAQAGNGHIQSANPVAPAKTVQSFPENFKAGNDRCPRCNDRVYYAEKWWPMASTGTSAVCGAPRAENRSTRRL